MLGGRRLLTTPLSRSLTTALTRPWLLGSSSSGVLGVMWKQSAWHRGPNSVLEVARGPLRTHRVYRAHVDSNGDLKVLAQLKAQARPQQLPPTTPSTTTSPAPTSVSTTPTSASTTAPSTTQTSPITTQGPKTWVNQPPGLNGQVNVEVGAQVNAPVGAQVGVQHPTFAGPKTPLDIWKRTHSDLDMENVIWLTPLFTVVTWLGVVLHG